MKLVQAMEPVITLMGSALASMGTMALHVRTRSAQLKMVVSAICRVCATLQTFLKTSRALANANSHGMARPASTNDAQLQMPALR